MPPQNIIIMILAGNPLGLLTGKTLVFSTSGQRLTRQNVYTYYIILFPHRRVVQMLRTPEYKPTTCIVIITTTTTLTINTYYVHNIIYLNYNPTIVIAAYWYNMVLV